MGKIRYKTSETMKSGGESESNGQIRLKSHNKISFIVALGVGLVAKVVIL